MSIADYTLERRPQSTDGGLLTLSSPTTLIASGDDGNTAWNAAFGFTFPFGGNDYTQCWVYSDGIVRLAGTLNSSDTFKSTIFDDSSDLVSLHPWHGQIRNASSVGYTKVETLGSAPSRYFVVEWKSYTSNNQIGAINQTVTFQLVLRESGAIEYRYGPQTTTGSVVSGGFYGPKDAVVGARTDTTGGVNGNIREFTELTGTPDPNGGVSTTPVKLDLDSIVGGHWPGDPTNSIAGETFNYHFALIFKLSSASATSATTIEAAFNLAPTESTVDDASEWTLEPTNGGAAVSIQAVDVDGATVTLTTAPAMTAGANYTLTATDASSVYGDADPNSVTFTVPASYVLPPSDEWDHGILRTLTHAWGQESQRLNGRLTTRLNTDIAAAGTVAWVESTLRWPDAGAFYARGVRFTYTGKLDGQLTGLATTTPRLEAVAAGCEVILDTRAITPANATTGNVSQLDALLRATTITYASGNDLKGVARVYGAPKPDAWDEESWRGALKAVAHGPRGTPGATLGFLAGAFRYLDEEVSVQLNPASPRRITAVAGAGTFDQSHVLRLVQIDGVTYYTVGPSDVDTAGGSYLDLAPVSTARFAGADWSGLGSTQTKTATFAPFTVAEPTPGPDVHDDNGEPCHVIVTLFGNAINTTPATYLQPASNWILFDSQSAAFSLGAVLTGGTSGASGVIRKIVENGTTGALMLGEIADGPFVDNETITDDGSSPGSATSNGTVGNVLLAYDNEAGGGFTVGDTVVGATSGGSGTITGLQDGGTSGLLVIDVDDDNAGLYSDGENLNVSATKRGEAAGDADTLARPTGQPDGGHIQGDEFEEGSQTDGPHPIYLSGSTAAPAVEAVLQLLLAAGAHARIERSLV